MVTKPNKYKARAKRHNKIRRTLSGTPQRPRLNVFRSGKHIYAQIIDDVAGKTLAAASSLDKEFEGVGSNKEGAKTVGKLIAKIDKVSTIDVVSHTFNIIGRLLTPINNSDAVDVKIS